MYYVGHVATSPGQKAEYLNFHIDVPDDSARTIKLNRNLDYESALTNKVEYQKRSLKLRFQELFLKKYTEEPLKVSYSIDLKCSGVEPGGSYFPLLQKKKLLWKMKNKPEESILATAINLRNKLASLDNSVRRNHGMLIDKVPRFEFKHNGTLPSANETLLAKKWVGSKEVINSSRLTIPPLTRMSIFRGAWIFFTLGFGADIKIEDGQHNIATEENFDPENYWATIYNDSMKTISLTFQQPLPFVLDFGFVYNTVMADIRQKNIFGEMIPKSSSFWAMPSNYSDIEIEISKLLPSEISHDVSFVWNPNVNGIQSFVNSFTGEMDRVFTNVFNIELGHFLIQKERGKDALKWTPNYLVQDVQDDGNEDDSDEEEDKKAILSDNIEIYVQIQDLDEVTSAWFPNLNRTKMPLNIHLKKKNKAAELREVLNRKKKDSAIIPKEESVEKDFKGVSLERNGPLIIRIHSHNSNIQYYQQGSYDVTGLGGIMKSGSRVRSEDIIVSGLPCNLIVSILNMEDGSPVEFSNSQDLIYSLLIFPL